ncbi:MAG: hopanoid biosynthesis-associated protein HpnK [Proteobacteria bacterium]|nr:hopanoid biosynthesis-associated protein HpnK [Pseudomonadota bacterium]
MSPRVPVERTRTKHLVVTADDFGLTHEVNAAVELAHTDGILSAASLMVAGDAAADAVTRARRLPRLGVGLHLVLVDGRPVLPPERIPALVEADGRFPRDPLRAGVRLFCRRGARAQAAAEIRAQLDAFRATGLALDHLNTHHHFHLHPTVQRLLLELAREQRLPPLRLPVEPPGFAWRAGPTEMLRRWLAWSFHSLRTRGLRHRLRAAGVACTDACFGIWDSGCMDRARLAAAIAALPEGVSEIYCHPATRRSTDQPARDQPAAELAALLDPTIRDQLARLGVRPVRFADVGVT